MQSIAKQAGVAVGTLYLYFPTKDHLITACVEIFEAEHKTIIKKVARSKRPADKRLETYVLHRFDAAKETRQGGSNAAELTRHVLRVFPDRRAQEGALLMETVRRIITEGIERGELALQDELETDLLAFMHAIAWFFPDAREITREEPPRADLERVIRWFTRCAWRPNKPRGS